MIVYLDVLIFENCIVNLFLLTLTAQTLKIKISLKRIILSSILGSMYVLTIVLPQLNFFTNLFFKLLVALLMIFIIVKEKTLLFMLKGTIIFILYSVALAGICFYLSIKDGNGPIPNAYLFNFSYKKLLLAIIIIYLLIFRLVSFIKERKLMKNLIFAVDVLIENKVYTVKALLDTGNELKESVSNLPVVLVERQVFNNINLSNYSKYHIPYSAVGGEEGEIIAIRPDRLIININGEVEEKNVLLGFIDKRLSRQNDYNGLLPRGIIE